ncbi:hypothetical protein [Sodalis praecaptivus]|nr:hypothetical protein [Sodalis praecaptivus]
MKLIVCLLAMSIAGCGKNGAIPMPPAIVDTGCSWVTPLYLTDRDIDLLDARTKKALLMHNETVEKNCGASGTETLSRSSAAEKCGSRYLIPGDDDAINISPGALD